MGWDKIQGAIRMGAAVVAGTFLSWVATWTGVFLDGESETAFVQAISIIFSVVYYLTVRALASKFPALEWLLVIPRSPVYVEPRNRIAAAQRVKNM